MEAGDTRAATAKEVALVDRFIALVLGKRKAIDLCLQTGSAASAAQNWISTNKIPYPETVFSETDRSLWEDIAAKATKLESYVDGLQTSKLYIRPNSSVNDFAIVAESSSGGASDWEGVGFGIVPLVILVAGVVLVAAAIAVAVAFYSDAEAERQKKKKTIAQLDAWALRQGGTTATSWKEFKEQNKEENSSFWKDLKSGAAGLILGGIAVYALLRWGLPALERRGDA